VAEHADRQVGGLRWGVRPICRVLSEHGCPIAPSTYYDARAAEHRPSKRTLRDEQLKAQIVRVHSDNYGVYGARKVWLVLNREGIQVARCTVERLIGELGLAGARRGRRIRTSVPDAAAARPADLVERNFNPPAPLDIFLEPVPRADPTMRQRVLDRYGGARARCLQDGNESVELRVALSHRHSRSTGPARRSARRATSTGRCPGGRAPGRP